MERDRIHCIFGLEVGVPWSASQGPFTLIPVDVRHMFRTGVEKLALAAHPVTVVAKLTDAELEAACTSGILCVPALSSAKPEAASGPCRIVVLYALPGTDKVHRLAVGPGRSLGALAPVQLQRRKMAARTAERVGGGEPTGAGEAPAPRRWGPSV